MFENKPTPLPLVYGEPNGENGFIFHYVAYKLLLLIISSTTPEIGRAHV